MSDTSKNIPEEKILLRYERGTLLLTGVPERDRSLLTRSDRWTWDSRVSAWRTYGIHYSDVVSRLQKRFGNEFQDDVPQPASIQWPDVQLPKLRKEQNDAVAAWKAAGGRGMIVMPTGTGKTEVALAALAEMKTAALIIAPVRDLMYQWHHRVLRGLGYDAGIVGDHRFNQRPVTVTTYDSAYLHMDMMGKDFGFVVFDEVHHLPGPKRREAAMLCPARLRLGLTATPERADGREKDLDDLIGPIVYRREISEDRGKSLADFEIIRIPVALNPKERSAYDRACNLLRAYLIEKRETDPKYDWQKLCNDVNVDPGARRAFRAYYYKKTIEDRAEEKFRVLEDLFRLHLGERLLVFTGSNEAAMDISKRFLLPTILSHTGKRERQEVLEGFSNGRFPVLVANRVLDEGIDVPAVKVAVVLGGLASTRQAKQRLGRILRRSGAARAVLYEVVCEQTRDEKRSRERRRSDAYQGTRHRRL